MKKNKMKSELANTAMNLFIILLMAMGIFNLNTITVSAQSSQASITPDCGYVVMDK